MTFVSVSTTVYVVAAVVVLNVVVAVVVSHVAVVFVFVVAVVVSPHPDEKAMSSEMSLRHATSDVC